MLLLDVGPFMHPALAFAAKAASAFILSKVRDCLAHRTECCKFRSNTEHCPCDTDTEQAQPRGCCRLLRDCWQALLC